MTLLALTSLPGCAKSGRVVSEYCLLAKPVYLSAGDILTQETLREIIAGNELWEMTCKL